MNEEETTRGRLSLHERKVQLLIGIMDSVPDAQGLQMRMPLTSMEKRALAEVLVAKIPMTIAELS